VDRRGEDQPVDEAAGGVGQVFDAVDVQPGRPDCFLGGGDLFLDGGGDGSQFGVGQDGHGDLSRLGTIK
jgi:hypothetical protein